MEFGFTEEQLRFRQEVRELCTREAAAAEHQGVFRSLKGKYSPVFRRRLAEKGWLGLHFPRKYGGQEKDFVCTVIFEEELGYSQAPAGLYSGTVFEFGDLLLKCGSERQRQEYLPRIARGEITAGHAYTEPDAGSDLASVKTRAVLKGDHYEINGRKLYMTEVHHTDYMILMARTDLLAPPEKGVSLFILDSKTPGIDCAPMFTLGGTRTNQVFLDNVSIPAENLIGEENKGWDYFMQIRADYWFKSQAYYCGNMQGLLERLIRHAKETKSGRMPLSQDAAVRQKLARMATDINTLRLLTYRMAWVLDRRGPDVLPFSAIATVFTNETILSFANSAMQVLGLWGQLESGSEHAPLSGVIENLYRGSTIKHFGSLGLNVTKNFVATYGLGLPGSLSGAE
ncbi:MAG: acyl-CoA/acyl-ACP dehydrogenase [Chloroflexi bacterium]|nr:acyl-CoA/acyl-ACP dehydrogenase [Chloroflexota bacterium]